MENLNLIGIKVNSMAEAIKILGCTKDTLINSADAVLLNGLAFNIFTFRTDGNPDWCYSMTATNLNSKQHSTK
ncbi:MAG: hypothetical protein V4666_08055 [Bacteroidota bacterium]